MAVDRVKNVDKHSMARRRSSEIVSAERGPRSLHPMLRLQQQVGNAQIARMLAERDEDLAWSMPEAGSLNHELAAHIQGQRNRGGAPPQSAKRTQEVQGATEHTPQQPISPMPISTYSGKTGQAPIQRGLFDSIMGGIADVGSSLLGGAGGGGGGLGSALGGITSGIGGLLGGAGGGVGSALGGITSGIGGLLGGGGGGLGSALGGITSGIGGLLGGGGGGLGSALGGITSGIGGLLGGGGGGLGSALGGITSGIGGLLGDAGGGLGSALGGITSGIGGLLGGEQNPLQGIMGSIGNLFNR